MLYSIIAIIVLIVLFFAKRRVQTPNLKAFVNVLFWIVIAYLVFMFIILIPL